MILGLTGSLGSGKSTVAAMLEEEAGAVIIDADAIASQVLEPGGQAYAKVLEAFGTKILAANDAAGRIDRQKLAAVVFSDPEKRLLLNSLVHPAVRNEELRLLDLYKREGRRLVVLMVPLLYEVRMQNLADRVAVVTLGSDAARKARLAARSAMSAEEVDKRLAAQMPEHEKIRLADAVIDNSGTLEETRRQVREMLAGWGEAPREPAQTV